MAEHREATERDQPLLVAERLGRNYGRLTACRDVSFALYPRRGAGDRRRIRFRQDHAAAIVVGATGAERGHVSYRMRDGVLRDLANLGEAERRFLFRTDWGYVHQDPAQGLRVAVSARRPMSASG